MPISVQNDSWLDVRALQGDRELEMGERIWVVSYLTADGVIGEAFEWVVTHAEHQAAFRWPKFMGDRVNVVMSTVRIGVATDGAIAPIASCSQNRLWTQASRELSVFTTAPYLLNWETAYTLRAEGDLPADSLIRVIVESSQGVLYHQGQHRVQAEENGAGQWPAALCRAINGQGHFLRGGVKDEESKRIVPGTGPEENQLWLPQHSNLQVRVEMPGDNEESWRDVSAIQSDRPLDANEPLRVWAVDSDTGVWLEACDYSPTSDYQQDHYRWPKFLADRVNDTLRSVRAGAMIDGVITSQASQSTNLLWIEEGATLEVFSTARHLDNWELAEPIEADNALPVDTLITVEVASADDTVQERYEHRVEAGQNAAEQWPVQLCQAVNAHLKCILAGHKDADTKRIAPIAGASANALWRPVGSGLRITVSQKDGEHTAEWVEAGRLQADRAMDIGETVRVAVFDTQSQAVLEQCTLTVSAENQRAKHQWPSFLSRVVNEQLQFARAGELRDGVITPIASEAKNLLWVPVDNPIGVFSTARLLANWESAHQITSVNSPLEVGSLVVTTIKAADGSQLERLEHRVIENQSNQFRWPNFLSRTLNERSAWVLAGVKDAESMRIVPQSSQTNNHIWVPQHSGISVSLTFEASEELVNDMDDVFAGVFRQSASGLPSMLPAVDRLTEFRWHLKHATPPDAFSFVTSVVFPQAILQGAAEPDVKAAWFEALVRAEVPAHIKVDVRWMDASEYSTFAGNYANWHNHGSAQGDRAYALLENLAIGIQPRGNYGIGARRIASTAQALEAMQPVGDTGWNWQYIEKQELFYVP